MSPFLKTDLTGYQVRAIVMVTLTLSGVLCARSELGADHLQSNNCIFSLHLVQLGVVAMGNYLTKRKEISQRPLIQAYFLSETLLTTCRQTSGTLPSNFQGSLDICSCPVITFTKSGVGRSTGLEIRGLFTKSYVPWMWTPLVRCISSCNLM